MTRQQIILLERQSTLHRLHKTLFDRNKGLKAAKKRQIDLTDITKEILQTERELQWL